MNILENYIQEIHSVTDVTNKYKDSTGEEPIEPLYKVDLTYDCYGIVERKSRVFFKSEFEQAKKTGIFLS